MHYETKANLESGIVGSLWFNHFWLNLQKLIPKYGEITIESQYSYQLGEKEVMFLVCFPN